MEEADRGENPFRINHACDSVGGELRKSPFVPTLSHWDLTSGKVRIWPLAGYCTPSERELT